MICLGKPAQKFDRVIKRRISLTANILNTPCNVLVFGCGYGYEVDELNRLGFNADGIDVVRYNEHTKIYDGVCATQFADNSFNAIVSYQVLEHTENESVYLKEAYRLLESNGKLIISVPNKWWLFEMHYKRPFNRIPFLSYLPQIEILKQARIYTKNSLKNILEENNFKVEDMFYMTAPMDRFPIVRFKNDKTIYPFMSTEIFAIAKRKLWN